MDILHLDAVKMMVPSKFVAFNIYFLSYLTQDGFDQNQLMLLQNLEHSKIKHIKIEVVFTSQQYLEETTSGESEQE